MISYFLCHFSLILLVVAQRKVATYKRIHFTLPWQDLQWDSPMLNERKIFLRLRDCLQEVPGLFLLYLTQGGGLFLVSITALHTVVEKGIAESTAAFTSSGDGTRFWWKVTRQTLSLISEFSKLSQDKDPCRERYNFLQAKNLILIKCVFEFTHSNCLCPGSL